MHQIQRTASPAAFTLYDEVKPLHAGPVTINKDVNFSRQSQISQICAPHVLQIVESCLIFASLSFWSAFCVRQCRRHK